MPPKKKPAQKPVKKPAKAPVKKVAAKPAKKAPAKKAKRKLNPALMKPWDYIKKNNLQDVKKRTQINADDALKAVFGGKKQVSMFEMTKLVSAHVK